MSISATGWLPWALLSAAFAAMTAILAKIGIANVDTDLATLLRTFVVVIALGSLWEHPMPCWSCRAMPFPTHALFARWQKTLWGEDSIFLQN